LLHREDWWSDVWGVYGCPPISEAVSIQISHWPLLEEAETFQERLRLLGIPGFFVAGLNPFDLAMYFALRNRSPSFDSAHQDMWPLRLLTVDDRLLAAMLRSARELELFGPRRFRAQYPFEARCWTFLRRVFGDELQGLLGPDGFALLESGRALDLHTLQDVSGARYWLEIFARRATAVSPARRDPKPKPSLRRASFLREWRKVRSSVEEYYPEGDSASLWLIPPNVRQILLVDKGAVARQVAKMKLGCGIIQVPYSRASRGTCRALAAEAKRYGTDLLFLGDLDPCALMLFANLCSSDPERPDARKRTMPIRWFGVDDAWLRVIERASGKEMLRRVSIKLQADEVDELAFFERRCGHVVSLAGTRSAGLLSLGRKVEVEALSCLGLGRFEQELKRRLALAPRRSPNSR